MNYPTPPLDVEPSADLGGMFALLEAARNVQAKVEAALDSVGLSPAKYQALDALVKAGQPLALSELAGCLNCVRSNVTQLADRLESDGLMQRVDDPTDRRAIRALITPLGAEKHAAGAKVIRALQGQIASEVGKADGEAFMRVLSALR
ncbi:MAG: MarR family transcriptional regulator [bacterium]